MAELNRENPDKSTPMEEHGTDPKTQELYADVAARIPESQHPGHLDVGFAMDMAAAAMVAAAAGKPWEWHQPIHRQSPPLSPDAARQDFAREAIAKETGIPVDFFDAINGLDDL